MSQKTCGVEDVPPHTACRTPPAEGPLQHLVLEVFPHLSLGAVMPLSWKSLYHKNFCFCCVDIYFLFFFKVGCYQRSDLCSLPCFRYSRLRHFLFQRLELLLSTSSHTTHCGSTTFLFLFSVAEVCVCLTVISLDPQDRYLKLFKQFLFSFSFAKPLFLRALAFFQLHCT